MHLKLMHLQLMKIKATYKGIEQEHSFNEWLKITGFKRTKLIYRVAQWKMGKLTDEQLFQESLLVQVRPRVKKEKKRRIEVNPKDTLSYEFNTRSERLVTGWLISKYLDRYVPN